MEAVSKETEVIAEALQKESVDLVEVRDEVHDLIKIFQGWRNHETIFDRLHECAENMTEGADVASRKPRIVKKQKGRPNVCSPSMSTKAYYRINLLNPFIAHRGAPSKFQRRGF